MLQAHANLLDAMRFAVLGPANGDLEALEKGASLLLFEHQAEQVVYLGADDALDRLVLDWAHRLVGADPSDEGVWDRAAARCVAATPQQIDAFVATERRRERLKALKCLPVATSRTIELLEGRIAVLLHDKALLDEEDILPASLLIFGKSREPLVRQVGSRTFVSPGELGPKSGVALFTDDGAGEINVTMYGPGGTKVDSHQLVAPRTGRFTVLDSKVST